MTNKHKWTGCTKYKRCEHPRLSKMDEKAKAWLKPNSDAFKALQDVVLDKSLLDALPHLTKFCHIGELEVFHSMLLKYTPMQHFPYISMEARTILYALDWNSNCAWEPQKRDDGDDKYACVYSKMRKSSVNGIKYKRQVGKRVQ